MDELNDFLQLVAEAKKDTPSAKAKKIVEEVKESGDIKNDLGDFLQLVAEGKKNSPATKKKEREKRIEEEVKANVQSDLSSLFSQLSKVNEQVETIEQPEIKEAAEEFIGEVLKELPTEEEIKEEVLKEAEPTPVGVVEVDPELNKYLKPKSDYIKQMEDPMVNQFKQVDDKLKFLERWVTQIQNTGPGGGAGEIYNLDHPTKQVTADYTFGRKDYYVGVYSPTKKVTITLPVVGQNVSDGRVIVVKDEGGRASEFPITVVGNVDNDPQGFVIQINNAGIQMIYRNGWRII